MQKQQYNELIKNYNQILRLERNVRIFGDLSYFCSNCKAIAVDVFNQNFEDDIVERFEAL